MVVTIKPAELPRDIERERDRLVNKLVDGLCERLDEYVGKHVDKTNGMMNDALDAIWFRMPISEARPDRAWNRDDPMEVMRAVKDSAERDWDARGVYKGRVKKLKSALDEIWTSIRGEGVEWADSWDVVEAVRSGLSLPVAYPGDDPTKVSDDVMVPAWLHNRVTGMAAAITAILDLANDCKPGEASAWSLDDPDAVVRMVRERMVRRDEALDGYEKMRQALDDIWHEMHGVDAGKWGDPQTVAGWVKMLVLRSRDVRLRSDVEKTIALYDSAEISLEQVVAWLRDALKRHKTAAHGCTTCHTHTCLHDNGCAHGHQANDVPMATERQVKKFIPPMQVLSVAVVGNVVNPDTAFANGGFTPTRPGCYTTEPVSDCGCCTKPISLGCDGCVANVYMTMGEANAHAAKVQMEMGGIKIATDPTMPRDEVVLRSHTVDGNPLDEVRVVNVVVTDTDPFAGVDVGSNGHCDECKEGPDAGGMFDANACAACPALGATDGDRGGLDPESLARHASVVVDSLGSKAREVVRFLVDRDPQTSLRILGAVFGGTDLDGPAGAESRVAMEQLMNVVLVEKIGPLPHDAGKLLMDRWTLTTLGREVARVLERG